ncbi:MAG: hypothetical protein WCC60_19985 [Ilumatobacteraceae bacterium]
MNDATNDRSNQMSRRRFAALGLAAGAGAALAGASTAHAAAVGAPLPQLLGNNRPEALLPPNPALTYVGLDAFAFFTDYSSGGHDRYYADVTGVGSVVAGDRLSAPLSIPSGSIIRQINVAYQGEPILEIWKRSMATPVPYAPSFQQTLPAGGGPKTASYDLATPIVVDAGTTMAVRYYTVPGATVLGVTIGYTPPTQSFIPFTGGPPRVLDTRGAGGKLAAGEERVITLGFAGARSAVLNLTVAGTDGAGGYVAVFAADIPYPGNSSINWSGPNQNVANGVITAMDPAGRIRIRGGDNSTHVIIDRIGWLL